MKNIFFIILVIISVLGPGFSVKCPVCQDEECDNPPKKTCGDDTDNPTPPPPRPTQTTPTITTTPTTTTPTTTTPTTTTPTTTTPTTTTPTTTTPTTTTPTTTTPTTTTPTTTTPTTTTPTTTTPTTTTPTTTTPTTTTPTTTTPTTTTITTPTTTTPTTAAPTTAASTTATPTKVLQEADKYDEEEYRSGFSKKFVPFLRVVREARADSDEYACLQVNYKDPEQGTDHVQQYCIPKAQENAICDQYKTAVGEENVNCTTTSVLKDASDQVVQNVVVIVLLSFMVLFAF